MTKCTTLLKGIKIIWLYGGYLATALANISECLNLALRYLRWSSYTLFHAVADKVSQPYVHLYMWCDEGFLRWTCSCLGNKSQQWRRRNAVIWRRGSAWGWSAVLSGLEMKFPPPVIPVMPFIEGAWHAMGTHAWSYTCRHTHTHTRARTDAHFHSGTARGPHSWRDLGSFTGGLRKGGVCADYKVMWKQKFLSCHYTVQTSLFFANTRHNR